MPKKRNLSESSDESKSSNMSSSSDEKEKASKKSKKMVKKSPPPKKNNNEWTLAKNRFVQITEFKNKHYLAIREYFVDAAGELKPSKRGINLTLEQWSKLKEFTPEIDEAIKKL